jgi:hypothetical protein
MIGAGHPKRSKTPGGEPLRLCAPVHLKSTDRGLVMDTRRLSVGQASLYNKFERRGLES